MNNGIHAHWHTYMSVDDLVDQALAAGKGIEMAKIDLSQAYHNVPGKAEQNCPICASVSPIAVYGDPSSGAGGNMMTLSPLAQGVREQFVPPQMDMHMARHTTGGVEPKTVLTTPPHK